MPLPHVVILGGGPAGLGAAYRLRRESLARVTLVERNARVGGNAGSFEIAGQRVDYGSHRLHPACHPEVLRDIRTLLGDDLLVRPRRGRIRLRGRWIHFPLQPIDLALRLPPTFALGVATDIMRKVLPARRGAAVRPSFATVLEAGLGRTICRDFYFPYARKVWGLEPTELAVTQARRRVSANSLSKMARKVLTAVPGLKPRGSGRFYYPRYGYGQISEAFERAARDAGADILLGAEVQSVELSTGSGHLVRVKHGDKPVALCADQVWSTLPVTVLARSIAPPPPIEFLRAAQNLDYRAMILIYVVVEQQRFTEYDAHYFPEAEIPISRLSEPKNYSGGQGPADVTVLCAEVPCAPEDPTWSMSDAELGELVCQALRVAGVPVRAPVRSVLTRRLRQAYPIYRQGYEASFQALDTWLSQRDGLLTFGRQGLFAHDNTHHALYMAYCAAACLDRQGGFDQRRWETFRSIFESHVVED